MAKSTKLILILVCLGLIGIVLTEEIIKRYRLTKKTTVICGDGICAKSEKCAPSQPITEDCGTSYCPADCR